MICNNPMNSEGIGSKRKALELITNIFCKKPKESDNSSAVGANSETIGDNSERCLNRNPCHHSLSVPEKDNNSCLSDNLPKSPISPRVKNIQEDMEALMLSRQDNPYIMQQLERLSTKDSELFAELTISANSSPARTLHKLSITNLEANPTPESNFIMDSDICDTYDDNLHDKLIRSPPPQFPKNLSLFVFPGSSAASIQSLRTGDNSDAFSSRIFLSPNLSCNSNSDMKSKGSNTSNDNISLNLKSHDLRHSKCNQYLEARHENYMKYERRGSDSSIMSNNWKTSFYNQSMTASSSSLLSFVPRSTVCPPINSHTSVSKDSNMSFNVCQTIESNEKSATDLMDVYSNLDEDNSNQMNFMSPSNSREALLKDVSQIT